MKNKIFTHFLYYVIWVLLLLVLEMLFAILLMKMGFDYFGMQLGGQNFVNAFISMAVYYGGMKSAIFIWLHLIILIIWSAVKKNKSNAELRTKIAIVNLLWVIMLLIGDFSISTIINPSVGIFVSSSLLYSSRFIGSKGNVSE